MSDFRFEIFAEVTPEQLQIRANEWLAKNEASPIGFNFALDGLERPYNLCVLYKRG